jgi:hypothetical protein
MISFTQFGVWEVGYLGGKYFSLLWKWRRTWVWLECSWMALAGTKARRRLGLAERPELVDSSFGSATRPWERAHRQRQHDQKQAASAALYNDDVGTHTNTHITHTQNTPTLCSSCHSTSKAVSGCCSRADFFSCWI